MRPTISVITPTYNRAHTLNRLWSSLILQSDAINFEWIIIDDGSNDDTHSLVSEWQDSNNIPIIYEYVSHRGKNAALNSAKKLISGDFVIVIDSDDCLTDGAFDLIRDNIDLYYTSSDATFGGLGFMCEDERGNLLFARKLDEPIRCSYLDGIFLHGFGDRVSSSFASEVSYLWKREYFQKLIYMEVDPPDHVPESCAYSLLSKFYQFVYVGDVIVRAFRHDGIPRLTKNWPKPSSKLSLYISSQMELRCHLDYIRCDSSHPWKQAISVSKFGYVCGISLRDQYRDLTTTLSRILWTLALPIGVAKGYLRSLKSKYRPSTGI